MHLTDIRIDEIVKVDGLPSCARGRATFTNGCSYAFVPSLAHGRPCQGGGAVVQTPARASPQRGHAGLNPCM